MDGVLPPVLRPLELGHHGVADAGPGRGVPAQPAKHAIVVGKNSTSKPELVDQVAVRALLLERHVGER
jgi:hypothetical protein